MSVRVTTNNPKNESMNIPAKTSFVIYGKGCKSPWHFTHFNQLTSEIFMINPSWYSTAIGIEPPTTKETSVSWGWWCLGIWINRNELPVGTSPTKQGDMCVLSHQRSGIPTTLVTTKMGFYQSSLLSWLFAVDIFLAVDVVVTVLIAGCVSHVLLPFFAACSSSSMF